MKKIKRIFAFILALVVFMVTPVSAYADDSIEGLIADMFGDGGAGNTTTIKHGCVTGNQGWLCYIVGPDGHVAFNPIFFYRTGGYMSPNECSVRQLTSRIDGVSFFDYRTDYEWPDAYYDSGNSYGMSNADAVRNWMIADSGNGTSRIFKVVNEYWGAGADAAFSGDDNYYFVMEPVFWHGTHAQSAGGEKTVTLTYADRLELCKRFYEKSMGTSTWNNLTEVAKKALIAQKLKEIKSTYTIKVASGWTITGDYCGTVYNGARYESVHGGCFSGVTAYRNGAYPNSIKVARDYISDGGYNWLKSAPHGGTIATNDIINYGYRACPLTKKPFRTFSFKIF